MTNTRYPTLFGSVEGVHVFYSHSAVIEVLVTELAVVYWGIIVLLVEMSAKKSRLSTN